MSIVYIPDDEMGEMIGLGMAYPIVTSDIPGIIDALLVLHCPPELLAELRKWAENPVVYELMK